MIQMRMKYRRFSSAGANRTYVTIDQIPKDLQHAFIAIEDERFYEHNGIDMRGILRAASITLSSGEMSQGAKYNNTAASEE